MVKQKVVVIACIFLSWVSEAQSTEEILKRAESTVSDMEYAVDVEYVYEIRTADGGTELETVKSSFKQFQDGYVQSLGGGIFQIQEDSLLLTIDSEEREVAVDRAPETTAMLTGLNMDMVDNEYFTISSISGSSAFKVTVEPKGEFSLIQKMAVDYSKEDYFPQKIEVSYSEAKEDGEIVKLTIYYKNRQALQSRQKQDKLNNYVALTEEGFDIVQEEIKTFYKIYNLW